MDTPKIGADRTGMMERYHEAVGLPVIENKSETAPVEADANLDTAKPVSQPEEAPKAPVAKEVVSPDPGVTKEVEKKEEPKTVPLEALHEAREKIKAKNLEVRSLTERLGSQDQELSDLKTRLAAMEDTIRQAKGEVDEPAPETVKLVEENKKLKEAQAKTEQEKTQSAEQAAKTAARKYVVDTDATLAQAGFPGFERFGRDVLKAINAKIESGEIEAKDVDDKLTQEIYKTEIYPSVKALFAPQVKQDAMEAKKKQKQAANLARNPGEGPTPKEEDNLDAPQTPESYMKARKILK